ncbi:hypothetical protein MOQ_001209 [Trypanosoma cruzi marinkellei]|uniref:Trichohyalin n=1 Tax=Trypanosoma cruzi marinkellei TaxID=85056 RepID=K2NLI0_TRYCR|nr:hypothetical protein MOQ_001209 [Trypanosoma cruzi marinkellei]
MFTPMQRGNGDNMPALSSPVSVRRVVAELLGTHAESPSHQRVVAGNACGRGELTEMKGDTSRGSQLQLRDEILFEVADDWHDASPTATSSPPPPGEKEEQRPEHHSSMPPASPSAWQWENIAIRMRQAILLQREESVVRREMEVFAREERLAQREEQLRLLQERLAPTVATDTYRQELHEAKCELNQRERGVAQQLAAQRQEKELLDARAEELDVRQRELEEEQERLLNDTREQVERIHNSARILQEKEATVARREENCSQRESELMLQRECLFSWEASLRRQQSQLDAQRASVAKECAAARELLSRESELQELEIRLREREGSLWKTAAEKVPNEQGELKSLIEFLRGLQDELVACEPIRQGTPALS